MATDVQNFSKEQTELLKLMISDIDGPMLTPPMLAILDSVLGHLNPDWEQDPKALPDDLRKEVEVCQAAYQYFLMANLNEEKPTY